MTKDEIIGRNLRELREGVFSQALVAHDMETWYGHKTWKQQTVAQVESGKRSLRLSEAVDLARYLDVDLDMLVRGL